MQKSYPIYDMGQAYGITTDLGLALANNYIGEQTVYPSPLASAMYGLKPIHLIYFGTPDEHLKKLFGY